MKAGCYIGQHGKKGFNMRNNKNLNNGLISMLYCKQCYWSSSFLCVLIFGYFFFGGVLVQIGPIPVLGQNGEETDHISPDNILADGLEYFRLGSYKRAVALLEKVRA